MTTEAECISMYDEAVSCLAAAAAECRKSSNVDITLMLRNCTRCAHLVRQLRYTEAEPTRQMALEQLNEMLNHHQVALSAKIQQLDSQQGPPAGDLDTGDTSTPEGAGDRKQGKTHRTVVSLSEEEDELPKQKKLRRQAIQETIVQQKGLRFEDVAGLQDAKEALREAIIMPLQYPHLFTGGLKPWRRILLYGPPGTGKSRLAQAVAAEICSVFYCVSSSDLLSSWVGESEKLIKELFHHAIAQEGRSVIFIDEIDSVCRRRSSGEQEHTRRVKTELLHQMEGAMMEKTPAEVEKVFLLAATNCPWELDPGFLRRFQKRIYIPLPGPEARQKLIQLHTKDTKVPLTPAEWSELIKRTEGYSGSDLANLVLGALFEPIRDLQKAKFWRHTPDGKLTSCNAKDIGAFKADMASLPPDQVVPRQLCLQDFFNVLSHHRRTVNKQDLERFDEFTRNFGQNG